MTKWKNINFAKLFRWPARSFAFSQRFSSVLQKLVAAHLLENGKLVWNTDNLSSGLYFCALVKQNGEVVETHKLVIAR